MPGNAGISASKYNKKQKRLFILFTFEYFIHLISTYKLFDKCDTQVETTILCVLA